MASNYNNTSNTTAQTTITVDQLISFAYSEAGKLPEELTPEYVNRARQALWYILINLSNRGVNLWLLDYIVMGSEAQRRQYTMPVGTVDVRVTNYRSLTRPSTTTDNTGGAFDTYDTDLEYPIAAGASAEAYYFDSTRFLSAGFYCDTANTSLQIEFSYDDITWASLGTVTNSDVNKWGYLQIDGSPQANYWRFRNTTASTINVRALSLASVQQDIPMARLNRDDYFSLPNKDFPGTRALQFWFDRQVTPVINLWPVPQNAFQAYQFVIEMQPQDVGKLTNEIAVPDRWVPAIQGQLSHRLAKLLPGIDPARIAMLKQDAAEATLSAEEEDRDKSPIYFRPNVSYYTR
jgi:hypothetical protein